MRVAFVWLRPRFFSSMGQCFLPTAYVLVSPKTSPDFLSPLSWKVPATRAVLRKKWPIFYFHAGKKKGG
jgi:hypothetical protein